MQEENNWRRERSIKAAATRRARYGPDVFKQMGSKGGKHPKKKTKLEEITPYEPLEPEK